MSDTWETDGSFEDQVELSSLDSIKANGISIRVNGQIIKFVADEVQDIGIEDEVRNELKEQYKDEVEKLTEQFTNFKAMVEDQVNRKNRELDIRERKLYEKVRSLDALPTITVSQMKQGLAVSKLNDSGYMWSFVCVYAPKYINSKIIDPTFAKRLMTPIRIFVTVNGEWKVTGVKLVKLINCDKFQHYHSMNSSRDCWGGMKYSGELLDTPEKALKFIKDTQAVLETINGMSIGNRAPKGLSRLSTVEKHLLSDRSDPENDKRTVNSRRNERAGFDSTVNDEVTSELWDTA